MVYPFSFSAPFEKKGDGAGWAQSNGSNGRRFFGDLSLGGRYVHTYVGVRSSPPSLGLKRPLSANFVVFVVS